MAQSIPEELIDEVRNRFDLVEFVGRYVVLRRSGKNFFGLCPFHSEKSPSFSVAPEKQIFYCFGCGKGGNIFTFVQEMEGLNFVEAVRWLAQEAGIPWPFESEPGRGTAAQERTLLYKAYELAAKFYHYLLHHRQYGGPGRSYLKQRSIGEATSELFQLGFAPSDATALAGFLKRRGFSLELLVKGGLLSQGKGKKGYYDKFRERLLFPIHDSQGRVVAFGGRAICEQEGVPKYLNTPETPIFHKGRLLFNLHRSREAIRAKNEVILMEGYVDVITAYQAGIQNVVATLGTSLTPEQARLLRRNAERVIVCYDSDGAGQSAALRGMELLLEAGCSVKVAEMPHGMDPDAYIRQRGGEAFSYQILAEAMSFTAFRLKKLREGYNLQESDSRLRYVRKALEVIADLPSAVEREHYLKELAEELQLSLGSLKVEQRAIYRKKHEQSSKKGDILNQRWNTNQHGKRLVASPSFLPAYLVAERKLLAWMLRDAEISELVARELGGEFNVEQHTALAAYLISYYSQGKRGDVAEFIHSLPEQSLVQLATELSMLPLAEKPTREEVMDYIQEVRNYPKWLEIKEKMAEMRKAERLGETKRAAAIAQEIIGLRQQLNVRYRPFYGIVGRREQSGQL